MVEEKLLLKRSSLFLTGAKKLRYNSAREIWEGARVVEWDSLENCCGLRSTEGSNPSLPAKDTPFRRVLFLNHQKAFHHRAHGEHRENL